MGPGVGDAPELQLGGVGMFKVESGISLTFKEVKMIGLILLIVGIILALIDAFVPTRPSWLLNVAVILIALAVLLGVSSIHLTQ